LRLQALGVAAARVLGFRDSNSTGVSRSPSSAVKRFCEVGSRHVESAMERPPAASSSCGDRRHAP
jgi:hypothetical protein